MQYDAITSLERSQTAVNMDMIKIEFFCIEVDKLSPYKYISNKCLAKMALCTCENVTSILSSVLGRK